MTAIREIKLLKELKHANIVKLEAVHLSRKVCKKTDPKSERKELMS